METAAQQPEVETAAQQMSEMDMEDQDDSSDEAAQEAPPDGTAAGVSPVLVRRVSAFIIFPLRLCRTEFILLCKHLSK